MSSALLPKTDIAAGPQGDGVHSRSNIPHDLASGSIPTPVSVTTEEQDYQYGGSLRCRCIFAASTHHIRSGKARKRPFESGAAFTRRHTISREGLSNGT